MKQENFLIFALALIFAFTIFPLGVSATLVPNGDFENGTLSNWTTGAVFNSAGVGITSGIVGGGNYSARILTANASGSQLSECTATSLIENNKTYDINVLWSTTTSGSGKCGYISVGVQIPLCGTTDNNTLKTLFYDSGTHAPQYKTFSYWNNSGVDKQLCVFLLNGGTLSNNLFFDNVQVTQHFTLQVNNYSPATAIEQQSFSLYFTITDEENNVYQNGDISPTINFNGEGSTPLTWDATTQMFKYTHSGLAINSYSYTVTASKSGSYTTGILTDSISVVINPALHVTLTPISNVNGYSFNASDLNLSVANSGDIVYKVTVDNAQSFTLKTLFYNSEKSGKQYYLYTSSDGVNWVIDDTLTFGSTSAGVIQKLWRADAKTYEYSQNVTYSASTTKYYKWIYYQPPLSYMTIKNSSDWAKISLPTQYFDNPELASASHTWDLFTDSVNTPLNNYTVGSFPILYSASLSNGFNLEFTAYSFSNAGDPSLNIGFIANGVTYNIETITIDGKANSPKRYSVFIPPMIVDSQLVMIGSPSITTNIYLTDYAIVPRAYFSNVMRLKTAGGNELGSVISGGDSYRYIQEGLPFQATTQIFNQNGEIDKATISVVLDGSVVKTYETKFTDKEPNRVYDIAQDLTEVIDYNGVAKFSNYYYPLRDVSVTTELTNKFGQLVAIQSDTVKLLQYPYFPSDIEINLQNLASKTANNPKVSLVLTQKQPATFIGLKFFFFDSTHSLNNPNYSETVYAKDLGCAGQMFCQKNLTFNNYSYTHAGNWRIAVAMILSTEPIQIWLNGDGFNNDLIAKQVDVVVTDNVFETARVLQVFERTDFTYQASEKIPLVLQVRGDQGENLKNRYTATMQIDINNGSGLWISDNTFTPTSFIYDDATGYNYWYFNNVFYDDNGDLIPDGNSLRIRAYLSDNRTQTTKTAIGLVPKCVQYPLDMNNFNFGGFLMSWVGLDPKYKCQIDTPLTADFNSIYATQLQINNAHSISSNENQSVICFNADQNRTNTMKFGDTFLCAILYRKDQAQIDKFTVNVGNAYSDYSKTGDSAQYLTFEIPSEQVIFNDPTLMVQALDKGYKSDRVDTLGGLLYSGFNQILPQYQGLVDYASFLTGAGAITNVGFDFNLENQLNPTMLSGVFFFTVTGMKATNQFNYMDDNPDLETLNPALFRDYALNHKLYLPNDKATVTIYSRDMTATQTLKINSPLVISERPKVSNDTNQVNVPTALKFNVISNMSSGNFTKSQIAFVPIIFSYVVPNKPVSIKDLMDGVNYLFTDPAGAISSFLVDNWFTVFILILFAIIVAFIYALIKGGGKISIQNMIPQNNKGV